MIKRLIRKYIEFSYRRRLLVDNLNKYSTFFTGRVLDIGGGRERGEFVTPITDKWVVLDIDPSLKPDVVADACNLPFKKNSFDSIKATELLEHVNDFEKAISEMSR